MKALSLTQPYATLIAIGAKRIETRDWGPSYRGPLAIHAAKGFASLPGGNLTDFCLNEPFVSALFADGVRQLAPGQDLPLGAVVAVATLASCIRLIDQATVAEVLRRSEARHERDFGDYALGRVAWVLRDVIALPEPIPVRGYPGLWEWDASAEVLALVKGRGHAAQE